MNRREPTALVREHYDRTAARYDTKIRVSERLLFSGGRRWAASHTTGEVLEVAVGTGRNLPHYPPGVRVTGVDVSPNVLDVARLRAADVAADVELRVADAQHLDFPADSFDTVVATLALCSVPDDAAATAEIARVLRPGGRLVLLEHVRSPLPPVRAVQRVLEPVFVRLERDHLLREPERRVADAGLRIEFLERSKLGLVLRLRAFKPH